MVGMNSLSTKALAYVVVAAPFLLLRGNMDSRPIFRQPRVNRQRGFTMIELALTFTIIAIMAAMIAPRFGRVMQATRVNRTAAIIAADLEQAFSLAARFRKPMRLTWDALTSTYTVADRTGGTVRLTRTLGGDSDLGTVTAAFSASPVDIFPSGVSSQPDTVRITSGISTRAIVLTTAGQVRIIP
jgi:prepilin-type N-terminal cleavage/methylation domain-containing protein